MNTSRSQYYEILRIQYAKRKRLLIKLGKSKIKSLYTVYISLYILVYIYIYISGLGNEIKMNIDITEIQVLNNNINFNIPKFRF